MTTPPAPAEPGLAGAWAGPGRRDRRTPRGRRWRAWLWALLYPRRTQRLLPTVSGVLLTALATGIGVAAYNAANNILFITLALVLSCMVLSGVLSWLNFRRVRWRLVAAPPWRVGQTATAQLDVQNGKRIAPTYALQFQLQRGSERSPATLTLRERLEPGATLPLAWTFRPTRRGPERVWVSEVSSLFPFGFLRKVLATDAECEVTVWPAAIEYQRLVALAPARPLGGQTVARIGHSGDLLALRRYTPGDSHRLIHWKASARLRQLMVRQFSTETQEAYLLWLDTSAAIWTRPEQFEVLCSFAVTLAEDLFKLGRLTGTAINHESTRAVRRLRDLEEFFDRVALIQPTAPPHPGAHARRRRTSAPLLTFAPEGPRQVAAFIDGIHAATA